MNEPEPQPLTTQAESQTGERGLWSEAPGWRNLAVGAAFLTAAAIALPLALPNAPSSPSGPPAVAAANPPATPPSVPPPAPAVVQPQPDKAAPAAPQPKVVVIEKYITAPSPAPVPAQAPAAQTQDLPSPEAQACALQAPAVPANTGAGTVMAFENRAASLARIPITEQQAGGRIDPAYVDNLRVGVHMDSGANQSFVVPRDMVVRLGDRVTVQSIHRNTALPCNYFPPLVTADLGPSKAPAPPGP